MKKMLLICVSWVLIISVSAQQELSMPAIPPARVLHHESIAASLNKILALPGFRDDGSNAASTTNIRTLITDMRAFIEGNDQLDNGARFKWLRGMNEMLIGFMYNHKSGKLSVASLPDLLKAFDAAMKLDINGGSIVSLVKNYDAAIVKILVDNYALQSNEGIKIAKEIVASKDKREERDNIFSYLSNHLKDPSADSLIIVAAFRNPDALYNYAAVGDDLCRKIRSSGHPLVKTIAAMAGMKTGRMYFPFLDQIYRGELTMETIKPLVANENSRGYFSLLVKTRISYAERMQNGDTPMAAQALTSKLQAKAVDMFINEINALHNERDLSVRFKRLEGLSAQELYYLAVMGEDEMYTSSFVSGVYPRIMKNLHGNKSDKLMQMVHKDYYRKFIKMCAAYNTLDHFLKKMDDSTKEVVMTAFVNGLEKTGSLEDAVDVADAYGSIYDKDLRKLVLDQVQLKLNETQSLHNRRGQNIYHLLNTIFQSMDTSRRIDITTELGINPVYTMPNALLKGTEKSIVIQQFFYGDKDGQTYFNIFLGQFQGNANWKIIRKANWVEVRSVKGIPVSIFSNLPLDEKKDLDARSQDSLIQYLANNELQPSIIIHRGHSYYLKYTIARMPRSGKVILVGSCGGYQNLNQVLDICPDAHIISSKQVGTGMINQGMINIITEKLRSGKDLDWRSIWSNLSKNFKGSAEEKFDDYVPPYKNLGAMFISAYSKADSQQQTLSGAGY
jgi:hypothetical protein